jgi:signal transduction histidine kinase
MRPLGVGAVVIVVVSSVGADPAPGVHGRGLAVLIALIGFTVALLRSMRGDPARQPLSQSAPLLLVLAASGLAIAGLQPRGATELAPSVAVFTAVVRLPRRWGLPAAAVITVGLAVTMAVAGDTTRQGVAASTLLCVLLAVVAETMFRAGESQDRAELLYAQLQDARDAQAAAAAIAERSRIAADLHDVLAHSLSGAAIQLQGARKLLERVELVDLDPRLGAAVDRAAELVRGGLDDAKRAVGALRGEELPALDQLPALISGFRSDQHAQVDFSVLG